MATRSTIRSVLCPADTTTVIWSAPSPGWINLLGPAGIEVRWDRASEQLPWYWADQFLFDGQWQQITYSPPSIFTVFRVWPTRTITVLVDDAAGL